MVLKRREDLALRGGHERMGFMKIFSRSLGVTGKPSGRPGNTLTSGRAAKMQRRSRLDKIEATATRYVSV
jgi:hypothetical protein